jgi:hypothetical protein
VLANTLAAGFERSVARCPLQGQSNVLLVAARDGPPRPPPKNSALAIHYSFARHVPEGLVLTDDYCPVESLTAGDMLLR